MVAAEFMGHAVPTMARYPLHGRLCRDRSGVVRIGGSSDQAIL